jgi:hypothetical protein
VTLGFDDFNYKRVEPGSSLFIEVYKEQGEWYVNLKYMKDFETSVIEEENSVFEFKEFIKERYQDFYTVFRNEIHNDSEIDEEKDIGSENYNDIEQK